MEPIYEKDGVKIYRDEDPPNPRVDYDNIGKMVCWHSRYALGDIPVEYPKEAFNTWEELEQTLVDDHGPCTVLPIYMYDHSGITISIAPFSCPWDSGQVGFIYCSEARALEEGIDDIEACLKAEVEEYDQYLSGKVYGYVQTTDKYKLDSEGYVTNDGLRIFKISEFDDIAIANEVVGALNEANPGEEDSCWGFYGYTPEELAEAVLKGEV